MTNGRSEGIPEALSSIDLSRLLFAWQLPGEDMIQPEANDAREQRLASYELMSANVASTCERLQQIIETFVASFNAFVTEHPELEWLDPRSDDPSIRQFIVSIDLQFLQFLRLYDEYLPIFNFWNNYLAPQDHLRAKITATQQLHGRVSNLSNIVRPHLNSNYAAKIRDFQERLNQLISDQTVDTAPPA